MELALGEYSVAGRRRHRCARRCARWRRRRAWSSSTERRRTTCPSAYGDGGRLTQCLMNLAGNALKFTRQRPGRDRRRARGRRARLPRHRHGIGIPPEQIEHIFAEFRQVDATITREFGGTGLGLSITKKFVEMHGGRIWVESELGEGSTFFFAVPLRVAEETPHERARRSSTSRTTSSTARSCASCSAAPPTGWSRRWTARPAWRSAREIAARPDPDGHPAAEDVGARGDAPAAQRSAHRGTSRSSSSPRSR